jgi:hypothetical protein
MGRDRRFSWLSFEPEERLVAATKYSVAGPSEPIETIHAATAIMQRELEARMRLRLEPLRLFS